jgi:hypothetical protein
MWFGAGSTRLCKAVGRFLAALKLTLRSAAMHLLD